MTTLKGIILHNPNELLIGDFRAGIESYLPDFEIYAGFVAEYFVGFCTTNMGMYKELREYLFPSDDLDDIIDEGLYDNLDDFDLDDLKLDMEEFNYDTIEIPWREELSVGLILKTKQGLIICSYRYLVMLYHLMTHIFESDKQDIFGDFSRANNSLFSKPFIYQTYEDIKYLDLTLLFDDLRSYFNSNIWKNNYASTSPRIKYLNRRFFGKFSTLEGIDRSLIKKIYEKDEKDLAALLC